MVHTIPKPIYDEESKPFWEGLKKHELKIQQCNDCNQFIFYPRSICPNCFSEHLSWMNAKGQGTIYSYTVIHQAFGSFKETVPYIVAVVELDEGVRMMTRIVGKRDQVAIDKRVTVTFQAIDDDFVLPYFRLDYDN